MNKGRVPPHESSSAPSTFLHRRINWFVACQHKAEHYLSSLSPPETVGGLDGGDGDDRRGAEVTLAPAQAWGLRPRGASIGGGPRGAVAGGWG